jgi:methylated-DNA-[protein]-cysteine S-methyltransferase
MMENEQSIIYESPFGKMEIGYDDSRLLFVKLKTEKALADSQEASELSKKIKQQMDEYFNGSRKVFDLPLRFEGTEFQRKVWRVLQEIPYGETRTYKEIAERIGNPKACRAVGMANNKNRIPIIIPCHRVIGVNGALVGYAGGLEIKEALLTHEKRH